MVETYAIGSVQCRCQTDRHLWNRLAELSCLTIRKMDLALVGFADGEQGRGSFHTLFGREVF